MKKEGFWSKDWFFALMIVIVVMVINFVTNFFGALETKAYDWGVSATSKSPSDRVAVIAIDEQSISNLGRWPWSREIHANMIDKLAAAKTKVIGHTVFFFEPQKDPGLLYINKLMEIYNKNNPPGADGQPSAPTNPATAEFGPILTEAEQTLNTDRRLAASIKAANNVVLPMNLGASEFLPNGKPDKPLPDYTKGSAVPAAPISIFSGSQPGYPIEGIGSVAAGVGDLSLYVDPDGGIRRDITTVDFFGAQQFPSLALAIAAKSLNLGAKDIRVSPGESVSLGNLRIVTDQTGLMFPYFYKEINSKPAIPVDSFFDVYTGKIPAAKYQDKIVLIGATAQGIATATVTANWTFVVG